VATAEELVPDVGETRVVFVRDSVDECRGVVDEPVSTPCESVGAGGEVPPVGDVSIEATELGEVLLPIPVKVANDIVSVAAVIDGMVETGGTDISREPLGPIDDPVSAEEPLAVGFVDTLPGGVVHEVPGTGVRVAGVVEVAGLTTEDKCELVSADDDGVVGGATGWVELGADALLLGITVTVDISVTVVEAAVVLHGVVPSEHSTALVGVAEELLSQEISVDDIDDQDDEEFARPSAGPAARSSRATAIKTMAESFQGG
jgi:hypothetical protein